MDRIVGKLALVPRSQKRLLMLAADAVFMPAALWTALFLQFGAVPSGSAAAPWPYLLSFLTSVPVFIHFGLYRAVIRYMGAKVLIAVFLGVTVSVLALTLVNVALAPTGIPLTAIAIYWVLALVYVGGSRILVRNLMTARPARGEHRVVIYGAGSAGAQVAAALQAASLKQ